MLSPEQFAALPDTLTVRQLRIKPTVKGFRTQSLLLMTTLLDATTYPAEALAALYFQRWSVELHFRELGNPAAARRLTVPFAANGS